METLKIIKALGDENRLRLVNILFEDELCGCEVEGILQMTQSNVSRHLSRLSDAKITGFRKDAKYSYYKLDKETLKEHPMIALTVADLRKEKIYQDDLLRLSAYKTRGLSCDTIKENILMFTTTG